MPRFTAIELVELARKVLEALVERRRAGRWPGQGRRGDGRGRRRSGLWRAWRGRLRPRPRRSGWRRPGQGLEPRNLCQIAGEELEPVFGVARFGLASSIAALPRLVPDAGAAPDRIGGLAQRLGLGAAGRRQFFSPRRAWRALWSAGPGSVALEWIPRARRSTNSARATRPRSARAGQGGCRPPARGTRACRRS